MKNLTILVNSCDAYEDLWVPFFSLLKRYWNPIDIPILLNTETKSFSFEGLNIECVHSENGTAYGKRIINALSHVKTPYVVILLDDFFIRNPVDTDRIKKIISWMEEDPDIACFTSDCTKVYADWEVDKYHGFRRVPPGNEYTLNLQAAIWNTGAFREYWVPDVSPWEWEEFTNVLTGKWNKHKFYCTVDWKYAICDYGYDRKGMGVFHGKWVIDDVGPLFTREGIKIDYTKRGVYCGEVKRQETKWPNTHGEWMDKVYCCLGLGEIVPFVLFCIWKRLPWNKSLRSMDYFTYISEKAKRKFMAQLTSNGIK